VTVGDDTRFDWEAAHESLEAARRAIEELDEPSGAQARLVLERRARELARPKLAAEPLQEPVELVVFKLGTDEYAVAASLVEGIVPLGEITPVPCTPSSVLGVISHRGRVLPVVDLRERPLDEPPPAWAVAVEADGNAFSLASDEVPAIASFEAEAVARANGANLAGRDGFVRGVVADMFALLDVAAIAQSPRIMVNDEAGRATP
jgi:purine-binding chemotaxis protein CheW